MLAYHNLGALLPWQAIILKLIPHPGVPRSLHSRLCCWPHAALIMCVIMWKQSRGCCACPTTCFAVSHIRSRSHLGFSNCVLSFIPVSPLALPGSMQSVRAGHWWWDGLIDDEFEGGQYSCRLTVLLSGDKWEPREVTWHVSAAPVARSSEANLPPV